MYIIKKVLNNSSVLVEKDGQEVVLIGKGIGFQRSIGEVIERVTDDVQKFYAKALSSEFLNNSRILSEASCIMNIILSKTRNNYIERDILESLLNHLMGMLVRIHAEKEIMNPFESETKILYAESYELSEEIASEVEREMDLKLPSTEIAFLTLYLHCMDNNEDLLLTEQVNAIVYEVQERLQSINSFELNKDTLSYARFVIHLKFFVYRVLKKEPIEENPLTEEIFKTYPQFLNVVDHIDKIFQEHLEVTISRSEKAYLLLHLARLESLQNMSIS